MLERFFKLKEAGTDVKTEVVAGATSFFAMAYIIFVNPAILSATGMDKGAVTLATCIAATIGTLLMSLYANHPFVLAPGMGINAFFAYTICGSMGYSWKAGLAAVFISGIIFILITFCGIREAIVNAIPFELKKAISAGIGLFIAFLGMKSANLLKFAVDPGHYTSFDAVIDPATSAIFTDASPIPSFDFTSPIALLSLFGIAILTFLMVRNIKGGMFIGILATSIIGCILQFGFGVEVGVSAPTSFAIPSIAPTFGAFIGGFGELLKIDQGFIVAIFSLISVLIALTLCDMFDTIGTLIGAATRANMLDEEGRLPRLGKALMSDAIATTCGAVLGTSTVTTFVESSAGVTAGGRTGLTSLTAAILFLVSIFAAPFLGLVPAAATAPVIIMVGVLMMGSAGDIDWNDFTIALPAFFTIACMAFSYSIADGIAAGFISFSLAKICQGKPKEVHPIMYVLSILFIIRFIIVM